MDDTLTDGVWVDARMRGLAADERWEPDTTGASRRFRVHRGQRTARHRRAIWLAPGAAVLTGLVIAVIATVPTTRAAAQRLWQTLRVDRTEIVRIAPGRNGTFRSFRLQLAGPPMTFTRAADATAAAGLAGFTPRLIRSPRAGTPSGFSVSSELRGYTTVDRGELVQALRRSHVTAAVPQSWDGARLGIMQGPAIIAEWPHLTLRQAAPPTVTVPDDFDWKAYAVVGLRVLGLTERAARRIADQPESVPTVIAASAEDEVVQVSLASGPGTIVRDFGQSGALQWRTLIWAASGRHFVLTGDASCAGCGHITDDFLIELADSVR